MRVAAGLVPAVAALVLAQQPAPKPDIKVTTRLVQISVLVLDNKGNPVEGLTKDDFEVLDKGKPQSIAKFSMEVRKPLREVKKLPPGLFTNSSEDPRKAIEPSSTILLFDGLNTPWADQVYARWQMVRFLASLQPGDKVAIYSLGSQLRMLHELTSDVDSLIRIAKRIQGQQSVEITDASIDTSDIQDAEMAAFLDQSNQRMQDFYTVNRVQSTLAAIEAIAVHTRKIAGRKNLGWLSASFPLWIGLDQTTGERRNFAEDVERTVRRINDSNIAIYPVDVRGLIGNPSFDAAVPGRIAIRNQKKGRNPMRDINLSHDTMHMLADRTGGKAYLNGNDITGAMRRTIDETRVSYLIGFHPVHDEWNSKWRDVKIKAAHSGVHLRYRNGYVAYPDQPPAPRDLRKDVEEAFRSPVESTDILLGGRLNLEGSPASALHTAVSADPQQFTFTFKDGRYHATIEIFYMLLRPKEKPELVTQGLALHLTKEQYDKLRKDGMILRRSFPNPQGLDRVKVVIADKPTGNLGSLSMSAANLPRVQVQNK
ncbi:MAG: VWA domain-containing protein [Acidobacteria bacterium]|nr:VWA domain-containing protein [Acidobacteriota bacterium]